MVSSDATVSRLRDAAKRSIDLDDFLRAAEIELADDLGVCNVWLAIPVGPQRCEFVTRAFDPMIDGLCGMVTDAGHPANRALLKGNPVWSDAPDDVRRSVPTLADQWVRELGAASMWAVPARNVVLVGVSDRSTVLGASNRARICATAELAALLHADSQRPTLRKAMTTLTGRQQLIVHFIARGMTNQQIARELDISVSTVASDAAHALALLGADSRAAATAMFRTDVLLDQVG